MKRIIAAMLAAAGAGKPAMYALDDKQAKKDVAAATGAPERPRP